MRGWSGARTRIVSIQTATAMKAASVPALASEAIWSSGATPAKTATTTAVTAVIRTGTPIRMTLATAVVVSVLAGLAPLDQIASLANAGTLAAFTAVSACLLVLRRRAPDQPRIYRTPLAWIVGPATILGCLYLFSNLQAKTQIFFAAWNLLGLGCYFAWRMRRRADG